VLVVEDEEAAPAGGRNAPAAVTGRHGGEWREALRVATVEGTIHVLLTDVVMPGMKPELAAAWRGAAVARVLLCRATPPTVTRADLDARLPSKLLTGSDLTLRSVLDGPFAQPASMIIDTCSWRRSDDSCHDRCVCPCHPDMLADAAAQAPSLKNPPAQEQAPPPTRKFDTSVGEFVIQVTRDWAPNGADRFFNLVKNGFYDDARFFRAIPNFMVQFGIHADPAVSAVWRNAQIPVDPVKQSNKRGFITYAMGASPSTRTTQVFINSATTPTRFDGVPPFGEVIEGKDVVNKIYTGYGEGAPRGKGPEQGRIQAEGNAYLMKDFPKLDYIKKATIEK
jgi:peptidyl-prolyl cis-trans isomerase A (cyclophilin A)